MATVNLGAIKFNWKGAFVQSNTYAVDDVVSSGGSSYVCILATTNNVITNTTYWNIMSLAGTNGTNGDTFNLANKEIAFKTNAGALDGIPIGTAGQALKVNSGATGYEFGAVAGGKILQVKARATQTILSTTTNAYVATDNYVQITPSATSSKVYISINGGVGCTNGDPWLYVDIYRQIGTGSFSALSYQKRTAPNASASLIQELTHQLVDAPNTTLEVTYKAFLNSTGTTCYYNGRSSSEGSTATAIAMEIGA